MYNRTLHSYLMYVWHLNIINKYSGGSNFFSNASPVPYLIAYTDSKLLYLPLWNRHRMHDIVQMAVWICLATLKHNTADLLKLNIRIPYNWQFSLTMLIKRHVEAVLFVIAQSWKLSKCPLVLIQINKRIYRQNYYITVCVNYLQQRKSL